MIDIAAAIACKLRGRHESRAGLWPFCVDCGESYYTYRYTSRSGGGGAWKWLDGKTANASAGMWEVTWGT